MLGVINGLEAPIITHLYDLPTGDYLTECDGAFTCSARPIDTIVSSPLIITVANLMFKS